MAVALATGSVTSIAFYNMILILICIVELVIQSFLIPLVQVYMVIRILNDLSTEEYLSKFGELLHTVVVWVLRTMLGAVIGINLIQGLLAPAIDSVKRSVLLRGGEAIPIIGDVIGVASEVVLGTTVLIKNGIGVAGAIICIAICMAPVVQMAVVTLMYKLTAALIQPISEKRIVGCVSSMADGSEILLRVIFTSGVLFLITIAMVANTTT
jgi:stage III sporulation protein AE